MEIVEKRGTSCRRLTQTYFRLVNWQTYASQNEDFGRRNRSSRGLVQSCDTPPHLLDNLHFDHFDKYFNLHVWFSLLSQWSKWRLSNKWEEWHTTGLVAYVCPNRTPGWIRPDRNTHSHARPCGKLHFREIATPDWVGQFTYLTHS